MSTLDFGNTRISRLLIKLAPPIMLSQLIQALYNITDSFFIGRISVNALTSLSIVYPLQLLMIALGVGLGVGVNTVMARFDGEGRIEEANKVKGAGPILALCTYVLFAIITFILMPSYGAISTNNQLVISGVITYGRIVCVGSLPLFIESVLTKVHQARGNMKGPMIAQIIGALVNIALDPLFIFVFGWDLKGAALATVIGELIACLMVIRAFSLPSRTLYLNEIFRAGFPNILMQSAYTFYIMGLNLILKGFCDEAVTALGLYYKWQTFFFIPLGALQTCIVPILSFNKAACRMERVNKTLMESFLMGLLLMAFGTLCFELFPATLLKAFTNSQKTIEIGVLSFRIIGWSFLPMVTSLIYPVYFQAIDCPMRSSLLTIIRTVVLFVPLGYIFSKFGLKTFYLTYPITEVVTSLVGLIFYKTNGRK